ncbi:hydroxyacylglutathione hydrolase [Nematocida minor]|uniref:hydroxyacylglutathione hydrolase n=1 Tax=Nematocida minor TaxID=1912983 RepID=UPI00221F8D31|nr:hydroxyacylglutathione hydrolase [Nematocida minor]KAI5189840.1 hydroxyacylglutathione hydrolase [Nematocida minor]
MIVIPIGVRQTNIMYVIIGKNGEVVFVDPIEPEKAQKAALDSVKAPSHVVSLTTHHHEDHSSGNSRILKSFPDAKIYAGSDKSLNTHICRDGEVLEVGSLEITCMHTPCHTLDSFTFFVQDRSSSTQQPVVFAGDTLFYLGCGRFTEGTGEMMQESLRRIASLPSNTLVYYGHDYSESNVLFRREITEEPAKIKTSGMFLTVEEEKENNLFINTSLLSSSEQFVNLSPLARLKLLRQLKDEFNVKKQL